LEIKSPVEVVAPPQQRAKSGTSSPGKKKGRHWFDNITLTNNDGLKILLHDLSAIPRGVVVTYNF
jgi:hypothetical protein